MQVAKKALTKDPFFICRSVKYAEHLLQNLQQLTDPPLDLNTVMQRNNILHSTPASHLKMTQWLRSSLQFSEEDVRNSLSKGLGFALSPVGTSVAAHA